VVELRLTPVGAGTRLRVEHRGWDEHHVPVWHVLYLTPQGRGDWYAELSYPVAARA
jgi:hypothetical protein